MSKTGPDQTRKKKGRRKSTLSPVERKQIARKAAAARWGHAQDPVPEQRRPYANMEPADAILLAAINLFSVQGNDAPTLKEIAAKADVGLQTIYRFYPTKLVLYQEAFNTLLKGQMVYFQKLIARNTQADTRLYALVLGMCYTHTQPHLIRLVYRELFNPESDVVKGISFLSDYMQPYLSLTDDPQSPYSRHQILQLLTTIQGFAQWVPIRDQLEEVQEILRDFETVASFSLNATFPAIDWVEVRSRVKFEPFDLQQSVVERAKIGSDS
ncbi:MAG: TetR/AcrR family transcriptional regulator [Porticoccaceae bacterium]